jgi:hypothetical protein
MPTNNTKGEDGSSATPVTSVTSEAAPEQRQPWGVPLPGPMRGGSSLWRRWRSDGVHLSPRRAAVAAAAVVVVVAGLGFWAWDLSSDNDDLSRTVANDRAAEADCAAARTAAVAVLQAASGYDYQSDPAAQYQRLLDRVTGKAHDYLADPKLAQSVQQAVLTGKVKRTGTVADTACERLGDNSIRVIGRMDDASQNLRTPAPVTVTEAVSVDLTESDSQWKATGFRIGDHVVAANSPTDQPTAADLVGGPVPVPPPAPPAPPAPSGRGR